MNLVAEEEQKIRVQLRYAFRIDHNRDVKVQAGLWKGVDQVLVRDGRQNTPIVAHQTTDRCVRRRNIIVHQEILYDVQRRCLFCAFNRLYSILN